MSHILFAWELGANWGHLTRDLPLARACRDAGHRVVMAVPHLRVAASFLQDEGFLVVQAPTLKSAIPRPAPPLNYADMLLHEGYDDVEFLKGAVMAWEGLLKLVNPSVMVYNHAPTALIAARKLQIPVLMLGTGFEIPPALTPMPSFRPWQDIPAAVFAQAENVVVSHINAIFTSTPATKLTSLQDLFYRDRPQLTCFAELDPFGPRADVNYIGPVYAVSQALKIDWHQNSKHHVFVYIRPGMVGCESYLAALNQLDAEVICAIPDAPPQWAAQYPHLRMYTQALDLSHLLVSADVVLTYGAGTISTALLAGVPVLLIPQVLEQFLTGLAMERTGAGLMLRQPDAVQEAMALLTRVLHEPAFRLAAQAFAKKYGDFHLQKSCDHVMQMLAPYLNT